MDSVSGAGKVHLLLIFQCGNSVRQKFLGRLSDKKYLEDYVKRRAKDFLSTLLKFLNNMRQGLLMIKYNNKIIKNIYQFKNQYVAELLWFGSHYYLLHHWVPFSAWVLVKQKLITIFFWSCCSAWLRLTRPLVVLPLPNLFQWGHQDAGRRKRKHYRGWKTRKSDEKQENQLTGSSWPKIR